MLDQSARRLPCQGMAAMIGRDAAMLNRNQFRCVRLSSPAPPPDLKPYPNSLTHASIWPGPVLSGSYSTASSSMGKLTTARRTPGAPARARSILDAQEAQDMPEMLKVFFTGVLLEDSRFPDADGQRIS